MSMHHDGGTHHENKQSVSVESHAQMMQSGGHTGSHDTTCQLLCGISTPLLPHFGVVPELFQLIQLWSVPETPGYPSNSHTLLYKPPRI